MVDRTLQNRMVKDTRLFGPFRALRGTDSPIGLVSLRGKQIEEVLSQLEGNRPLIWLFGFEAGPQLRKKSFRLKPKQSAVI